MPITTIIFDLDGTLMNTLDDLCDSVNYVLDIKGYPKRSIIEIRNFVGNGIEVLIKRAVPANTSESDVRTCLEMFQEYYSKNMQNKTAPYEGIYELLAKLNTDGFKLAIVSNKYDLAVKKLNEQYFSAYIKVAVGEGNGLKPKPEPDLVYKALSDLESTIKESIYVGDSDVDVLTAKNSHLPCIGVTWGFRDRDLLARMGADYIVDDTTKLYEIISDL